MFPRTSHDQRSHVELITVYEICRILGASLDIERTFVVADLPGPPRGTCWHARGIPPP